MMKGLFVIILSIILFFIGILLKNSAGIFFIVISLLLIYFSVVIVRPNTVKTVEFLGKYDRILRSGINFIIPIIERTVHQDLFRKNFNAVVESITSDNVSVSVGLNVIYYVNDDNDDSKNGNIYKSVYSISNFLEMLRSTIDEQLRAMISTFDHKEIFLKRQEIGDAIEANLREKLSQFGYTLDSIQVKDIILDPNVVSAMNKVVASQKLKEAAINEGEAEKIKQIKQAEADKESKILIGQGMAGQRMEIAKGFKESVEMIMATDKTLTGDKILKFLLDSSRIETLGNIGNSEKTKLIYLNEDLEGRGMDKEAKLIAGSELMEKQV